MLSQFVAAINQLCDEKGLDKDKVYEVVRASLKAAYRKDYGNKDQNLEVDLDEKRESFTIFLVKDIVSEVENPETQIALKDAMRYRRDAEEGEQIKIDVTPLEFGRIAAQSAKQVIIQKIHEAEREMMYEAFKDRENELINGMVQRVERKFVYVNLDNKLTNVLTPEQQIPRERYFSGQRLKLYLDKVTKTSKGPQVLISRSHPNLVVKLMELEIPEIKSGLVEIKGISREAGVRSKVAVASNDPKIDPIGSCVGQKGVRVQNVMDELNGERIDVIPWSNNVENYIKSALAPAKIVTMDIDEEDMRAKVYVNPDQRPLAIGKNGQNVRLASKLTEFEIDILDISELKEGEEKKEVIEKIVDLPGINDETIDKLLNANLELVQQLHGLSVQDLMGIEGITQEEAEAIANAVVDSE